VVSYIGCCTSWLEMNDGDNKGTYPFVSEHRGINGFLQIFLKDML
jgi:hypothetical protein